eukprot:2461991-Rhodomonas_salina.2
MRPHQQRGLRPPHICVNLPRDGEGMGRARREEERGRDEALAGGGKEGARKEWGARREGEKGSDEAQAGREEEKGRDGGGMVRTQRESEKVPGVGTRTENSKRATSLDSVGNRHQY